MRQLVRVTSIFATYPLLILPVSMLKDKFCVNSLPVTEIKMCHFDCFSRSESAVFQYVKLACIQSGIILKIFCDSS